MAKVGVLIGPMFEDVEYTEPARKLADEGHELVHIGLDEAEVEGKKGERVSVEVDVGVADPSEYDALFIPGGFSPDKLRADDRAVDFVRRYMDTGKHVFAICHAPQLLMSADRVSGRRLTAYKTVQSDLQYTGADVVDEAVVEDGNLVTSRNPDDIPGFCDKMLEKLGE